MLEITKTFTTLACLINRAFKTKNYTMYVTCINKRAAWRSGKLVGLVIGGCMLVVSSSTNKGLHCLVLIGSR